MKQLIKQFILSMNIDQLRKLSSASGYQEEEEEMIGIVRRKFIEKDDQVKIEFSYKNSNEDYFVGAYYFKVEDDEIVIFI